MQHVQGVASQALRTINNCRDANLSHRKRKTLSDDWSRFRRPFELQDREEETG